jgi:hypothetical protein
VMRSRRQRVAARQTDNDEKNTQGAFHAGEVNTGVKALA